MERQAQAHELSDHLSGRPTYFHIAGPGVSMSDLLVPAYWSGVSDKFRGKRWVVVEAVSASWECRLRVDGVKPNGEAAMTLLWEWHASSSSLPQLPPPI